MCPDRSDEGCGGLPLPVLARQREETRHRERNVISDLRPRPFEEKPQALGQGQGRIDEPPLLVLVVRPPLEAAGDDSPIRVLVRVAVAGTQIPFRPPEIEVLGQPRGARLVRPSLDLAEIGPVLVNEIELGRCHGPPRNRRAEGGDMRAAEGLAVEPCVGASTLKDDRDRRVVDGGHANVSKRSVDIAACVVSPGELNEPLRGRLIERLEIVVSRAVTVEQQPPREPMPVVEGVPFGAQRQGEPIIVAGGLGGGQKRLDVLADDCRVAVVFPG